MQLAEAARAAYVGRSLPRFSLTNVVLVGTVAIIAYLVLAPIIFLLWSSFRTALPTPANPGLFTLRNYTFVYSNPATYTLFLNTAIFVTVCTSPRASASRWFRLADRTDRHSGQRHAFRLDFAAIGGAVVADGNIVHHSGRA